MPLAEEEKEKIREEEKYRAEAKEEAEVEAKKKPLLKQNIGCGGSILIIIIIVIMIAIFSGGGEKESSVSTSEKTPTVYSINQDVRVGDVRWKLVDVRDRNNILKASESKYSTIAEDKTTTGKFIEITMEVENLSTEMKTVSNLGLVDNKNREFICASDVSEWIPEGKELFLLSNLNPNIPQQFTDIYEVPADATNLKVKVGDLSFWGTEEALISLGL